MIVNKVTGYTLYRSWPGGAYKSGEMYSDSNSTRLPDGKIDLTAQNAYDWRKSNVQRTLYNVPGTSDGSFNRPYGASYYLADAPSYASALKSANNEAYARWNGKLRKGSASMGVTLATWRQTSRMITARHNYCAKQLDSIYEFLRGNRSARKRIASEREPLAGQVLEGFFGWAPLIEDVRALHLSVMQDAIPNEWVKSTANRYIRDTKVVQNNQNGTSLIYYEGNLTLKYVASVRIDNPNLWLANRAGLLNLPSVAWDLVPWSFVVNMFSNANTLINLFSDRIGLVVNKESVTTKTAAFIVESRSDTFFKSKAAHQSFNQTKKRVVNVRPTVSWEVKVPEFSWSLAAIASSLVVQKISRINRLLRFI